MYVNMWAWLLPNKLSSCDKDWHDDELVCFVCQDGRAVAGGKAVTKQQAEASILKRPEPKPAKSATVEPIQLPASFKDAFKYKVRHGVVGALLFVALSTF